MSEATSAARGLVVDDDPAVIDYLETLLRGLGIEPVAALDGREAERALRRSRFDVMLLDMRLPVLSGDLLLDLLEQGVVPKPTSILLMSAYEDSPRPSQERMVRLGITGFLEKPIAVATVRGSLEAALGRLPGKPVRPVAEPESILVGGVGLWVSSLAQVILKGEGVLHQAPDAVEALEKFRQFRSEVVVLGPPIGGRTLGELVMAILRQRPQTKILVGLDRPEALLERGLLEVGVRKVLRLPAAIGELSGDVIRLANLKRRQHRRAAVASPVLILARGGIHDGVTVDVGEGGIGVTRIGAPPKAPKVHVEFTLPNDPFPITAESEVMWTRPDETGGFRAGMRFTGLPEAHRERIRKFVSVAA